MNFNYFIRFNFEYLQINCLKYKIKFKFILFKTLVFNIYFASKKNICDIWPTRNITRISSLIAWALCYS